MQEVHRLILSDVVHIQILIKDAALLSNLQTTNFDGVVVILFLQGTTLKHLISIFIFIFNLLTKLVTKTRKTTYQSRNEKETSTSEEATSSISYRKSVLRRKRGVYSNTYGNPIK